MAGQIINLTRQVTTIAPKDADTDSWQPTSEALDVTGFPGARFDFSVRLYVINGTAATPSATVKLYTSMSNDDGVVWAPLGTFSAAVTTANPLATLSVSSTVLRYVRWKLEFGANDNDLIVFEILGVAW